MPYASASDVSALCQVLISPQEIFTESTSPTLNEVDSWLSSGCAVIESHLSSWGYSTPVASGNSLYNWIRDLNCWWATSLAHMSRTVSTVQTRERTVGQLYNERFWENMKTLSMMDLTLTGGVSRSSTPGTIYVGGISKDDKQTYETDSDRVAPRFGRDQFAFPGIERASTETTAS